MATEDISLDLNFGWVVPPFLAGSALPGLVRGLEADLEWFRKQRIDCIVSATETGLPRATVTRQGFDYLHLPVDDMHAPSREQMLRFCEYVREARARSKKVLVHCLGGVGRTGTFVASYLILEQGMTSPKAMEYVRENRLGVGKPGFFMPSREQIQALNDLAGDRRRAKRG